MRIKLHYFTLFSLLFILTACTPKQRNALFTKLSAEKSGIDFRNDLHDNDSSYSFINEFGYMGGGVGIGDFNNDGLKDIFFTGNQVSCRLYINKGSLAAGEVGNEFEDITQKAGLVTNVWATGVSIADVNNDGYDDIYVCVFGKNLVNRSPNLLFINQHDLTFKEQAADYGLADTSYSTQAAFFDYDRDGDLDLYVMNYLLSDRNANTIFPRDKSGRSPANDKLYRNEGYSSNLGHPVFVDFSLQANIKEDGYGLGLSVSDFNDDGWPDIYVANDFLSNDEMWLNNHNGTFTNCIDKAIQHQSYSSMGSDAADINNDGLPDLATLDMLPEYNERKKTSFSFMNYERYQAERSFGYEPEFSRNMLQLNNGDYTAGDTSIPFFSEIGQLAGISETDWSWSVLMADFNNDGWKDIHITNGIGRDFINTDFIEFSNQVYSTTDTKEDQRDAIRRKLASLNHVNLPNYFFINQHNYTFADSSEQAGINEPSMSNGAAYADLDNDGDLDLVINNINKEAFVFINNTRQQGKAGETHFLKVHLRGDTLNKNGFGAKLFLYSKGDMQMQEQDPVRGYFSSVDQELLFGLGKNDHIDSLTIVWPDQKRQILRGLPVDTLLVISRVNAADRIVAKMPPFTLFSDVTSVLGISYIHHDNSFNDFASQRLLPQKYSQLGPFIATGDVNNDGATDFFIGGGFNFSGKIFKQQKQSFIAKDLIDSIKLEEDMDCIFFDADNDGDADLLVTSGDVLYEQNSIHYKPRLYFNDGKGNFSLQSNAIPNNVKTIAGCVCAADYDGDGDLDIFIGGRVSGQYPLPPRSFLLQNNLGHFTDVTTKLCPALQQPGMITAAVWTDFDGDQKTDLIIAGEWMPIRFFKNDAKGFREVTTSTGLSQTNGMWRSLVAVDIDNDGDVDLVAGNLGLNCKYHVTVDEPMELFASDLDNNGSIDPIPFYYIKDQGGEKYSRPAITRSQFADQVPAIKKQFLFAKDYAHASFDDIFQKKKKNEIFSLSCHETRTCFFENQGNGKFIKHALPMEAQFAPVNAILCDDFDNDGIKDLLLAGNEYQADVITGRYDASYGCFLKGSNKKRFIPLPPTRSGFRIRGDVKDLALIYSSSGVKLVLAAVNNDSLKVFRVIK